MNFYKEKYTSNINIYYTSEVQENFYKRVVDYFWLNKDIIEKNIELFKTNGGRGIKIFKITYEGRLCYLKKHSYKRIGKRLQNSILRKPEGFRNLKKANQLLEADILTAKPIFSATKRNMISFDSIYFTEKAEGIEFEKYIKKYGFSGNKRLIKTLGRFWAKFVNNNFVHQDPGLDNLFINVSKKKVKLTLIDLDDIYHIPLLFVPKRAIMHILARFIAKIYICLFRYGKNYLVREDLNLFLKEFINSYNKNFSFEKLTNNVDKMIIKKIIRRDWGKVISNSSTLSNIYNTHNFS